MPELNPEDVRHLVSADGWLRLGNAAEAKRELAQISPGGEDHPDLLQARWRLACLNEDWTTCETIARRLTELEPDGRFGWLHLADTFFRSDRPGEAYRTLAAVVDRLPSTPTLPFHLARYACAMGDLELGRQRLREAIEQAQAAGVLEGLLRRASDDPALEPIRDLLDNLDPDSTEA